MSTGFNPLTLARRARLQFRAFRRTRPFWAAIWIFLGGFVIFEIPYTGLGRMIRTGLPGVGGAAIGILIMIMALFILATPSQRYVVSVVVAVLALASFPISNLGGFFVGMMSAILGASMAFAWMPEKPARKYRWFRRIPQADASAVNGGETDTDHAAPAPSAEPNLMAQPAL